MKMNLKIEPISNGYIITGPEFSVYRERPVDAVTQAQTFLDEIGKELKHPTEKKD